MTPRTVVTALNRSASVGEAFKEHPTLPFGRMPVFGRNMDDILGVVRSRDLLKAKAHDQDAALVEHFMQEAQFIPETATVNNALQLSLKTHTKLLVAVDEFGATAGVVTMEDVIEHLLGREIFEKDDVAVDYAARNLARTEAPGSRDLAGRAGYSARPPSLRTGSTGSTRSSFISGAISASAGTASPM